LVKLLDKDLGRPMMRRTPLKRSGFKSKRRKPMRQRVKSLKNKLWGIVSECVRRENADENGMVRCFTCPVIAHWKTLDCGHYVAKSLGLAIYFEPRNLAPQCTACNRYRHGNLHEYALALRRKYGETILEELDQQRRQIRKISEAGYQELIEVWEAKLAAMDAASKGATV
jgi:hypothetical protein